MGNSVAATHKCLPQTTVPTGKIRICIAGFNISHYTGHARKVAHHVATHYGDKFESWYYFDSPSVFQRYLINTFDAIPFPEHLKGHGSSPFVWLEEADTDGSGKTSKMAIDGNNRVQHLIGGGTALCEWVKAHTEGKAAAGAPVYFKASDAELAKLVNRGPSLLEGFHSSYGNATAAQK